jgi:hypothetical protein
MGREEPGDYWMIITHSMINEWGGAWMVPDQVRAIPEPKHG